MTERLIVDIERLDRDGEQISGVISTEVLDLKGIDAELFEPIDNIHYDFFMEILGDELLVRGSVWQSIRSTCVRCARKFNWERREPQMTFSVELGDEAFLDLTNEVREAILIGFPNHPLCAEDCKGLCPICGVDLSSGACGCKPPVDDRWGALEQLDSRFEAPAEK